MEDLRGKVLLIVNTAARCGLTPQYEGLEALYEKDRDRGFEIPDFPRNQFAFQAPRDAEKIDSFRKLNYDTNFPRFAKIKTNGSGADPLCVYMKEQKPEGAGGTSRNSRSTVKETSSTVSPRPISRKH